MLEEALGFDIDGQEYGDEFTFFSSLFTVNLAITDRRLIINDIIVSTSDARSGIGRAIISAVHQFCRMHCLESVAQEVEPTEEAQSFWISLGYTPDGTGNYCREDLFADAI